MAAPAWTPPRTPKRPPPEVTSSPRLAALARALDTDGPAALARFWEGVARAGTPMVEPCRDDRDHRIVTFLWRDRSGAGEGTRAVVLMANKLTDPSVWEQSTLDRLAGTDLWHRSFRLRSDWRGTYRLAPDDGTTAAEPDAAGPASRWRGLAARAVPDPLNRRRFPGAAPGDEPSSIAELPDAPPQPWAGERAGVPSGALSEDVVDSRILANQRKIWIYTPPGGIVADPPVLVLLDGEDWARRLPLRVTLDNLIADRRIPPIVAVLPSAIDLQTRWRELGCHPPFVRFLEEELLAWLAGRFAIRTEPERTVIAGRSLGGLTALYAGLHGAGRFGMILAQSASLWHPTGDGRDLADAYAAAPRRALGVYLEVGLDEWVLLEPHRRLEGILAAKGYRHAYREYNGGHDALCWQGGLADGLIALLGEPGESSRR